MASVKLINVNKVYDGGVHAVHDFSIDIKDGEFIVFVGPSGCGKSTTLRMIAGLEEISYGELYIDGKLVNSAAPKDRDIAMVFQSYALYPQMTVYNNMAYALKLRKVPKEEIDRRVKEAAKILKLTPYLDRKPRALSGGQRQRVALGRSIVRRPKVFLMDEPLSNLDAKLRVAMRSEIVRIHEEVGETTIYVTHDQIEAMTMASRIVVMKDGFIQQIGEPNEVYQNPANMFVAGFIGTPAMNFLHGTLQKGWFVLDNEGGKIKLTPEQKKLLVNYEGKRLVYGIRPENLIYEQDERFENFKACSFEMSVGLVELLGDIVNIHGKVAEDKVVVKMNNKFPVKDKTSIKAAIDAPYARFFNETTTRAITPEDCEYEEVEVTKSLDEDNVVIIDQKPKGLIAKAVSAIKDKTRKNKNSDQATTLVETDNEYEIEKSSDKDKKYYCKNCGKELEKDAVICPNCGVATENVSKIVPAATKRNTMAIVGFIFAFFGSFIGLILSIIGLSNSKKPEYNGDGKGLAIAGIVLGCLSTVAYIILLATCAAACAEVAAVTSLLTYL